MNIFDLTGPAFLGVFLGIAVVVLVAAHWLLARLESGGEPPLQRDPYVIAYLRGSARSGSRGGADEALRVATLSLVDRGLLVVDGGHLRWRTPGQAPPVRHPIEKLVVAACTGKGPFEQVLSAENRDAVRLELQEALRPQGLLPGSDHAPTRVLVFLSVAGVLWAVAGYKLVLAAERGRGNVAFLWILAIIATLAAVPVVFRRRTSRADRALAVTKELFSGLPRRSSMLQAGKDPLEVLQLAAAFGVGAVPLAVFPHRELLGAESRHRPAKSNSGGAGSDGAGCSSCGSSVGSSCGSSSCGGGGGGCGGCGS